MALRPPSPTKLPTYCPPAIARACTPSPPPLQGKAINALVAPLGCELIIRDIIPSHSHTSMALLKDVINSISASMPDLAALPVKVDGSGGKDTLSTFCYVQLSDFVSHMDPLPRPDLLWLWAKAICSTKPEWNVGWSPQPRKDKKLWVRISEVGEVSKESKDRFQMIEKECVARGYAVHSIFPMTNSVGIILSQLAHAEALINNGITVPSISAHPLPTFPFCQLESIWAFELVISGISRYYYGLVYALDQYLTHNSRDDMENTLFHASRTQDDYYCFLMRDWPATKHVLLKSADIESHFSGQKLSKPTLIYKLNMGGTFIKKNGVTNVVKKAAIQLNTEVDALRKDFKDMCCETKQNFAITSQQFQAMNSNMNVITSTLSSLHTQLQNTTHAMLGQCEEKMIGDKMHATEMRLMDLERMHDRAVTVEEKSKLTEKIKYLEASHEQLRGQYENIGTGITSILTGPVQVALPPPPTNPGLPCTDMPPPPPHTPTTPSSHRNNHVPPTPATTPSNNAKHAESSGGIPSPAKKQQVINTPIRLSAHLTHAGSTSSVSSVESILASKSKKPKKDHLIFTMGEDVFSDDNMDVVSNTMEEIR